MSDYAVIATGDKRAIHFGRGLFGFVHLPAGGEWRSTGVVLVAPIGTDFTRSDRAYRHLAERLAQAGFAVLRYDPFGTGDSAGDEHAPSLARAWIDDVGVAVDELRARSGATSIALCGLRLGATMAMAHAAERAVDALVAWSPCISGRAFVTEAAKLHKLYARIEPLMAGAAPPTADGDEALGLFVPRALAAELSAIDLLTLARKPADRALVIDGGNLTGRDQLMQHLATLGVETELRAHPGHKFLLTVSHRSQVPDEILQSITSWLGDRFPSRSRFSPPPATPAATATAPDGERAFIVDGAHPLFGIFTPSATKTRRPPIILSNAGCVNRSGPHRTYTRWARHWARLGFDVLRLDLAGIGDSPAPNGAPENVTYPPSGLDDLRRAIDALGADRVIISGLCSGGDYAFQLGAREQRVAGAIILNPRTFCMLDLQAVESADGAPPQGSGDSVPATLRKMAERGCETLLLVSHKDPGIAYVDAHFGDEMRALDGVDHFQRIDIDGSDHTFTPVSAQARVEALVTAHLEARYKL